MLVTAPTVTVDTVWHIGWMDIEDKSSWSLEGHSLSVSVDPEAWTEIARLGGRPRWRLDGPFRMVDAHLLADQERDAVTRWAVTEGLVEEADLWAVTWFDDEIDDCVEALFETEDEAAAEVVEQPPELRRGLRPTGRLTGIVGRSDPASCFDHVLIVWAEANGFDGVWFDDVLDPAVLSAPRGALFDHARARATVGRDDE